MTTSATNGPTRAGRAELLRQVRAWRARRRWAFVVSVVTGIVALGLAASAVTLFLGTLSFMAKDYQVQRHMPGADTSITLPDSTSYILLKPGHPAPACVVRDLHGASLLTEPYTTPGKQPESGMQFYADKGSYRVTCEGGQDGVGVFNKQHYESVLLGVFAPGSPIIPLAIAALVVYFGGRFAAGRIAPESKRPTYSTGTDAVGEVGMDDEALPTPQPPWS